MIVMPPIEWPTSTIGPVGTTWSRTALRSRPSCSMVLVSATERLDRPWLRWSQNTRSPEGAQVPALVVPAVLVQGVAVAEDDRELLRVVPGAPLDLGVQRDAVGVGDGDGRAPQVAERLVALPVGAPGLGHDGALGHDTGGCSDHQQSGGHADGAGHLAEVRLVHAPTPRVVRWIRGPSRVMIS